MAFSKRTTDNGQRSRFVQTERRIKLTWFYAEVQPKSNNEVVNGQFSSGGDCCLSSVVCRLLSVVYSSELLTDLLVRSSVEEAVEF